jgi:uncharacterized membrane protein
LPPMEPSPAATTVAADPRHVSYTHLMYALHAFAVLIGILTSAMIVDRFLIGLPSIIAVIMNFARRNEVRDTWLASHFRWQLRTFFIAAALIIFFSPLVLTIVLIPLVLAVYAVTGIWVAYRIARGWLALRDGRSMPGKGI